MRGLNKFKQQYKYYKYDIYIEILLPSFSCTSVFRFIFKL